MRKEDYLKKQHLKTTAKELKLAMIWIELKKWTCAMSLFSCHSWVCIRTSAYHTDRQPGLAV